MTDKSCPSFHSSEQDDRDLDKDFLLIWTVIGSPSVIFCGTIPFGVLMSEPAGVPRDMFCPDRTSAGIYFDRRKNKVVYKIH